MEMWMAAMPVFLILAVLALLGPFLAWRRPPLASRKSPSQRPAPLDSSSAKPRPTKGDCGGGGFPLLLRGNAPESWPPVSLEGPILPGFLFEALAISAALAQAFKDSPARLSGLAISRLTSDGVVEPHAQVSDGDQTRDVFFYPQATPEAAAHFAAMREIFARDGLPEPVYYCPELLPEATGVPGTAVGGGVELGIEAAEAPAGEYAMWWPDAASGPFSTSRTAALLAEIYQKSRGVESYVTGFLLNRLGEADELGRISLPEGSTFGVKGPEDQLFVLDLSRWHGIRFGFSRERTPPEYRDRFLKAFLRLVEWTQTAVAEQGLPKDEPQNPTPFQWWTSALHKIREQDQAGGEPTPVGAIPHGFATFLPGVPADERERLLDAVQSVVEREGGALDRSQGSFTLSGVDATFGLKNLAQTCHQAGEARWQELIGEYLADLREMAEESPPEAWADARPLLAARLYPERQGADHSVLRRDLPGMVTMLAVDLPKTIQALGREDLERWGVREEEAWQIGLDNLLEKHPICLEESDMEGPRGLSYLALLAAGPDGFVASHALWLDRHLADRAPHGCLVAIPTHHHLIVYPILPSTVMPATPGMCLMARAIHDEGPQSLEPDVFLWRKGKFSRLRFELQGGAFTLHPPDEYMEMLKDFASADANGGNRASLGAPGQSGKGIRSKAVRPNEVPRGPALRLLALLAGVLLGLGALVLLLVAFARGAPTVESAEADIHLESSSDPAALAEVRREARSHGLDSALEHPNSSAAGPGADAAPAVVDLALLKRQDRWAEVARKVVRGGFTEPRSAAAALSVLERPGKGEEPERLDWRACVELLSWAGEALDFDVETSTFPNEHHVLLQDFSEISHGAFQPTDLFEVPPPDDPDNLDPYRVGFISGGRAYTFLAQNLGDWYDVEALITAANRAIRDTGRPERFVSMDTGDQGAVIVCMTPARLRKAMAAGVVPPKVGFGATERGKAFEEEVRQRYPGARVH